MGKVSSLQEEIVGTPAAVTAQKATVSTLLESASVKNRLEKLLGDRRPAFISTVISIANTPALAKCEPMSIVSAAIMAATLDLPINQNLGFAHIVPYNTKVKDADGKERWVNLAQLQIGWKGYYQLALRTNQYQRINATPVYEGQIKYYNRITDDLEFDADVEVNPNAKPIGYVAYYRLINGFEKYLYMTMEQIEAHAKQYSKSFQKGYGIWRDNFDAMARKTVIKLLLSRYGILSIDLQKALIDDQSAKQTIEIDEEPIYIDNAVDSNGLAMIEPDQEEEITE